MVPKGWSKKELGDIAYITSGGTPSREKVEYWANGTIPWIRTTEVQNCVLNLDDTKEFITELGLKKSSAKLVPAGSILLAMIGQGKTRGQVALLNFEASTNQNCAVIILNADNDPVFYFNYLLSQYESIRGASNSAGQSNLSSALVKAIRVSVPPYFEQQKIAQILSTWDQAISITEKLLDNSQQQKKALMQQLLTGKKRLLDAHGVRFNTAWEKKKLRELGEVVGGLTYTPEDVTDSTGNLVLRSSNIQNGRLVFNDNVYVKCELTDKTRTKENDILICVRNGSRSLIGKSALLKDQGVDCFHGAFMTIFRTLEPLFIFQIMQSDLFFREVNKNLGATINSINGSDLRNFSFLIPTSKEERDSIASVLSTADLEIDRLYKYIDFLKREKKALMQQLLTGKKRVKVAA
ncbi:restriction endonuclease subunit S [Acinetobacter oleivorans]|uniref:restriction endonuclease subunit S n=1 Tax=Acinetobacter oleivorans TaxID=1148157 RepID=UPI0017806F36|nr:restriction endonuclease subunit S [Acinetobacter oleivorans]